MTALKIPQDAHSASRDCMSRNQMAFATIVTSMTTRAFALIAKKEKMSLAQSAANVQKDSSIKTAFVNPANSIDAPTALKTSRNATSARMAKYTIWT